MAYKFKNSRGKEYILHERRSGRGGKGRLFFFAKDEKQGSIEKVPEGYRVEETDRGLPVLKREDKER